MATPTPPTAAGPATPPTRRRSAWGCLFTGATGCAAFLVGALVAALALSPKLFGPMVASRMASAMDAELAGALTASGEARLRWAKPFEMRGVTLAHQGSEVLAGDLSLPGMLELLGRPGTPTVAKLHVPSLSVALDARGRSKLLAALARASANASAGGAAAERGALDDPLRALRVPGLAALGGALRLEITCDELAWSDARAEGTEARFGETRIDVTSTPGAAGALEIRVRAKDAGGESEALRIDVAIGDAFAERWSSLRVDASLAGAPAPLLDALLGTEGWIEALAGERVDVALAADGDPEAGAPAHGSVASARGDLAWRGEWRAGSLRVAPGALTAELAGAPPIVRERLDALLAGAPGGAGELALAIDAESGPWVVRDASFELATGIGRASGAEGGARARWSARAAIDAPGRVRLVANGAALAVLQDAHWTAVLDDDDAHVTLDTRIAAPGAEDAAEPLHVEFARDLARGRDLAPEPRLADSFQITADLVPSAALDALLGPQSWIADALGPAVSVTASADGLDGAPVLVDVELESSAGSVRFRGSLEPRALVSTSEAALVAKLPLCASVEARVLRPLFPWLTAFAPATPGAQLELALAAPRLPLDGDLAALSAVASISAPGWTYGYLQELASLALHEGETARFQGLGRYVIPIENGVATYDALALAPGRGTVDGEVSLADERIELELVLPIESSDPESGESSGDEPATVALDLHGDLAAPRVGMGFEQLGDFVRESLQGGILDELRARLDALFQREEKRAGEGEGEESTGDGDGR